MVKKVCIEDYILHFREPFAIAYERVTSASVVIIHLHDEKGRIGLGSAAPDPYVTGETTPIILRLLKKRLTEDFFDLPLGELHRYHKKIQTLFKKFPSAQSAVEEALINLLLARRHKSVTNFFHNFRRHCNAVITVGINDEAHTIQEIKKRLREGFSIIKLKCGDDLNKDIRKIFEARNSIPNDGKLLLDANQGYSFKEAVQLLHTIKKLDIAAIEQPIAAKDINGLKKLRSMQIIPIIADEAASDVDKTVELLRGDYVDGINIKLMKQGGLIGCANIFYLAKKLGKLTMLGCMYESNISITTGARLASALPFDFVDLDSGHLDFYNDPTKGGAYIKNGKIKINGLSQLIAPTCIL